MTASPVRTDTPPRMAPPSRRRWMLLGGALVAAWVVPLLTHALGLDVLLPPLILLVTASLLSGRTLFDRLVVALALLFGVLCVAGLVISVWPWGLHPVALAGFALSALVLGAVVSGRRPGFGRGPNRYDLMAAGAGLVVAVLAAVPFIRRDVGGRLGILAPGEDFARHFVLMDTIGFVNGYAFQHRAAAAQWMEAGYGLENYPQGLHLLYAVLDRFTRSATTNADGVAGMNWLIWCYVATFGFFAYAVLWAIRRVAGPEWTGWAPGVVIAAAGAYLWFGDPVVVYARAYPNQIFSLALVAILVAILARPVRRVPEQVLLVAALLVGISFTYYMYLPVAAVIALGWLAIARKRLWQHRIWTGVAILASTAALIPPLVNTKATRGAQLLLPGTALSVSRKMTALLLIAVVAGLLIHRAQGSRWIGRRIGAPRGPAWLIVALGVLTSLAFLAAIGVYQQVTIGRTIYYYEKAYHLLVIVVIVGLGACARLLPPLAGRFGPVWAIALALVPVVGLEQLKGTASSTGRGLLTGKYGGSQWGGQDAVRLARLYPAPDGKVTVDLMRTTYANHFGTLYASVMQRNYRVSVGWYVFTSPTVPKTFANMEQQLLNTPQPVRFALQRPDAVIIDGQTAAQSVAQLKAKYPDRVEIVQLP